MSVDLLPRVVLHTTAGAVVIGPIDPTSPTTGTVLFPLVGAVPYTVVLGFPASTLLLHFSLGDVPVPIDLFGGGGGTIPVPLLGDVPYELVLGPPQIAASDMFGAGLTGYAVPIMLGIAALWLLRRRR